MFHLKTHATNYSIISYIYQFPNVIKNKHQVSKYRFSITRNPIYIFFLMSKFKMVGRKEMFYLTTHSTHFIYSYMALDIW